MSTDVTCLNIFTEIPSKPTISVSYLNFKVIYNSTNIRFFNVFFKTSVKEYWVISLPVYNAEVEIYCKTIYLFRIIIIIPIYLYYTWCTRPTQFYASNYYLMTPESTIVDHIHSYSIIVTHLVHRFLPKTVNAYNNTFV